jgi:hypothetical protein
MTSTGDGWACEAYGPEAAAAGALCFVAEPGQRVCADPQECARTLAAERRRVFRRIQELSATDGAAGEAGAYLETVFTNPDQLLGGPGEATGRHAE